MVDLVEVAPVPDMPLVVAVGMAVVAVVPMKVMLVVVDHLLIRI